MTDAKKLQNKARQSATSKAMWKKEGHRENHSSKLTGRERPDQTERMSGDSNIMAGKVSPNRGKEMPQISEKIKGKKKPEGFGDKISRAKKGVPVPKLQGRKKPEQSARLKINNPGFDATRIAWKCPHCGKEGVGSSNYSRWHGDNCKAKK
jgi:hypothetical protein